MSAGSNYGAGGWTGGVRGFAGRMVASALAFVAALWVENQPAGTATGDFLGGGHISSVFIPTQSDVIKVFLFVTFPTHRVKTKWFCNELSSTWVGPSAES